MVTGIHQKQITHYYVPMPLYLKKLHPLVVLGQVQTIQVLMILLKVVALIIGEKPNLSMYYPW
ncbi:MAG: hypothetical protein COB45_14295 [Gammaproteobacteria bacterium]|nr:MAG: hypothetical protein COB45_14295 [Gammaproteobacteria bacterium]